MSKISTPLKTFGGKGAFNGKLAKWIISLMPEHTHYMEPYFGGGSVLLEKDPEGVSEVVNDINGKLMNFWRVLKYDTYFRYFCQCVEATPFSQAEWENACGTSEAGNIHDAARFFIRCRQSRAGQMKEFATLSRNRTRRGMNEQASAWLNAIDGLPAVHARLKRVVILNDDALNVIRKQDGDKTLFYCDPPYLHETRMATDVYEHEMTDDQHVALLECLATIKGKFLLSGYRNGFYDEWTDAYSWHRRDFEIANNASGKKKKPTMTECVWTNYQPPEAVA